MSLPVVYCLDLEGVFVPEIWIEVAKRFKLPELRRTTRDEPDYDKLMRFRLGVLKRDGIKLRNIQKVIAGIKPLPGAKNFLDRLRKAGTVIILSDTYYEFAGPLMEKLGSPTLFCNFLKTDSRGFISGYVIRRKDGKFKAVRALQALGFRVHAAGDSYNDVSMLQAAERGVFFNPPESILRQFPKMRFAATYPKLLALLTR